MFFPLPGGRCATMVNSVGSGDPAQCMVLKCGPCRYPLKFHHFVLVVFQPSRNDIMGSHVSSISFFQNFEHISRFFGES